MKKIDLDFSRLPDVSLGRSFWLMPNEIEVGLSKLPETAARCRGAMWLCYRAAVNTDHICHVQNQEREVLFRAALAEFASMNDAVCWDFNSHPPLTMSASSNPLVHFVRLLRHANIHLAKTSLETEGIDAIWIGAGPNGADHEFKTTIQIIPDLKISRLEHLRDFRLYHYNDLTKMCEWFDLKQRTWGAPDLVWRAAEYFATEIIETAASYAMSVRSNSTATESA